MPFKDRKVKIAGLTAISLMISWLVLAQGNIIELDFGPVPVAESDLSKTLQSLTKVQGTGGYCQTGLYLINHFGDREEIFQKENQELIDKPVINQTWRHCSIFSTKTEGSMIMGRNWDNENVGSIIVNLYHPPDGYASISFSRAIELGFPLHMDLERLKSSELGNRLLLAPFYSTDGINECGLAVAVSGVRQTNHTSKSDGELIFPTFLMRKILDQTKSIEEAVNLVEKYVPFLLDKNSFAGHFLIVDSTGRSVILEYEQDQWKKIYGDKSWQVLTNKPIFNVPDENLREECWRFKSISETLETAKGELDWKAGMKILQDVAQKGTTWSVVYSLPTQELYFSVYQSWDTVYHLKIP